MKTRNSRVLFFFIFLSFAFSSESQVVTQIISERDNFTDIVKGHIENGTMQHELEAPDVDAVLAEDEQIGKTIPRFAIKKKTDFTERDGEWFESDHTQNWKFTIFSRGATSINFLFKDLNLPILAKMYIYSENKQMIMGPIISKNIKNGFYATDVVYGEEVTIEVILPQYSNRNDFKIGIDYISYGIQPNQFVPVSLRAYGDSEPCNNDINCAVGNPWSDVRDGVALILVAGQEWCSGSLVEDECNSGRPFFLTAFHCLDNGDGFLDNYERTYPEQAWAFRFFYESPSCSGPEPTTWVSFSGAEFKAGWVNTDFLLLELLDVPGIQYNQVNSGTVDDDVLACIHHPQGDVKKISIDDDGVTPDGNFWIINEMDDGVLEPGSSGAPVFDFNHLIISQHAGRSGAVNCMPDGGSNNIDFFSGRIDISWTGGGTDDTRLSTWLGNNIPADVSQYLSVVGPKLLCTGEEGEFCLSPYITVPDNIVNWSISPSNWFDYPAFGNNTCARIKVKDNFTESGLATLTFIGSIPYGHCSSNQDTIEYSFWVGKPEFTLEADPLIMCPRDRGIATLIPIGGFVNPDFNWTFSGAISGLGTTGVAKYTALYPGLGQICASVTNSCGTTTECLTIKVDDCGRSEEPQFSISPNPANNSILITLFDEEYNEGTLKTIKVIDQYSTTLFQKVITENMLEVDISLFKSGIYFVSVSDEFDVSSLTFVKQ